MIRYMIYNWLCEWQRGRWRCRQRRWLQRLEEVFPPRSRWSSEAALLQCPIENFLTCCAFWNVKMIEITKNHLWKYNFKSTRNQGLETRFPSRSKWSSEAALPQCPIKNFWICCALWNVILPFFRPLGRLLSFRSSYCPHVPSGLS